MGRLTAKEGEAFCEAHWARIAIKVPAFRNGLCRRCFRGQPIAAEGQPSIRKRRCSIQGCERILFSRNRSGFCIVHRNKGFVSGAVRKKRLAAVHRHYRAHKEKIDAASERWRKANREKHNASKRRWRKANLERVRAADRRRYKANRKKIRAVRRRWREANREKVNAAQRRWYHARKNRCAENLKPGSSVGIAAFAVSSPEGCAPDSSGGTVTKRGSRMKLTLALSVWLALAGSAFSAQSSTDAGAKSEKTAKVHLAPRFKNLAEDTLDAVDRLWGESAMSDEIFEPVKLEAERLRQKLRRAASSSDEKKISDAIGRYFGQIQLCRVIGPANIAAHEQCLQEERAARTAAVRSLGRETPQPSPAK